MRISDWSSDVCSSDLGGPAPGLPVELRTNFRAAWSPPQDYEGWDFDGQPVKEGVIQLDDSGEQPRAEMPLARSVPLTLDANGTATTNVVVDEPIGEPTMMAVEMDYADANGETLTSSRRITRSEEHTSELQSLMRSSYAVFCLK